MMTWEDVFKAQNVCDGFPQSDFLFGVKVKICLSSDRVRSRLRSPCHILFDFLSEGLISMITDM